MSELSTNEIKPGSKIMLDGEPCNVVKNEYVKPGKGQAFNRITVRYLKTNRVVERTFKSGDTFQSADVTEHEMQYLYNDGHHWHFMASDTFEQVAASKEVVADAAKWIKENDVCAVTLWNGEPLMITPPNFVVLQVTQTDPGLKGDTSGGGGKPATLETGAVVRVPLFVQIGDLIKVDTRNGSYVSRAKE